MKNQKPTFIKSCFIIAFLSFFYLAPSLLHAQDAEALNKKITEAGTTEDARVAIEGLRAYYFKDNKYSEFVDSLKPLTQKRKDLQPLVSYYMALARYQQLKYLEEKQLWEEYFNNKETYLSETEDLLSKVISGTANKDTVNIHARLLSWRLRKDQEDASSTGALSDLLVATAEYSKTDGTVNTIKEVADQLLAYAETAKADELYRVYVDKLIKSDIKDGKLKDMAFEFYNEGNTRLSEDLYDAYIGRISKSLAKEKVLAFLEEIAGIFSFKDKGACDPFYAEKIFKQIESLGGKDFFDEALIYLRAFNLEKAREYPAAADNYLVLLARYPKSKYTDEVCFKLGIISLYILRNPDSAKTYFGKLAQQENPGYQTISSLYQLGLLSQWQDDYVKAAEYYNLLLAKAKDGAFQETVGLAKERLKEIENKKPIEYNLKTFLDASFKEENAAFVNMTKLDLKVSPSLAGTAEEVSASAKVYTMESGCMEPQIQYLWSGHLGKIEPRPETASFTTTYINPGTKEIGLVVISSSGIVDRSISMVDVH